MAEGKKSREKREKNKSERKSAIKKERVGAEWGKRERWTMREEEKKLSQRCSIRKSHPDAQKVQIPFCIPSFLLFFCYFLSPKIGEYKTKDVQTSLDNSFP